MPSVGSIAAIVTCAVGLLLVIVATGTTGWTSVKLAGVRYNSGLFRLCVGSSCGSYKESQLTDWQKATRAFMVLTILVAIPVLVLLILRLVLKQISENKLFIILTFVLAFVAAFFNFLGVVIYGAEVEYNLSYSFAIAVVTFILFLVTGVLSLLIWLKDI